MIPPVLPAINIFGKSGPHKAYDVTESIVNHRPSEVKGADYDFFGVIQPTNPRELELLPEGERTKAAITIHTRVKFYIADQPTGNQTYIKYQGKEWKVTFVGDWENQGFRRYIATSFSRRT